SSFDWKSGSSAGQRTVSMAERGAAGKPSRSASVTRPPWCGAGDLSMHACARAPRLALLGPAVLVEELRQALQHRAAELLGVDDGDGAPVIAGDVVADADRGELDGREFLDLLDHLTEVLLQIIAGIDRKRGIV